MRILILLSLNIIFYSCNFNKELHSDKSSVKSNLKLKRSKVTEGFQSINLPGNGASISLLRLGQASDSSYWSVVKFPKGFHRSDSVFLGVEEGYLIIQGELKYNNTTSLKDTYSIIPAGVARAETQTEETTIAIARFSNKPFWLQKPSLIQGKDIHINSLADIKLSEGPFGSWQFIASHSNVNVGYLSSVPTKNIKHRGGVIYSISDSVIVEISEGEPFPKLNKPFMIWANAE